VTPRSWGPVVLSAFLNPLPPLSPAAFDFQATYSSYDYQFEVGIEDTNSDPISSCDKSSILPYLQDTGDRDTLLVYFLLRLARLYSTLACIWSLLLEDHNEQQHSLSKLVLDSLSYSCKLSDSLLMVSHQGPCASGKDTGS